MHLYVKYKGHRKVPLTYTYIDRKNIMTQVIVAASNALHIDALLEWFRDQRRAYKRNKDIRTTMKELHALTDKELWDIGMSRGDIWEVSHNAHPTEKDAKADANDNLKGWV